MYPYTGLLPMYSPRSHLALSWLEILFDKSMLYIRIKPCLQIVSPDKAHVFGDHAADLPSLNVRDKLFPTGLLEVCPAPSDIRIVGDVGKSPLGGIAFEHGLLRVNM